MTTPLGMAQAWLETATGELTRAIGRMLADIAKASGRLTEAAMALTGQPDPAGLAGLLGGFAILLLVAAAAAWFVHRGLAGQRRRLDRAQPQETGPLVMAKLEELLIGLAPAAVFLAAAQALTHALLLHRAQPLWGVPPGSAESPPSRPGRSPAS